MRHGVKLNHLGRKSAHRKALLSRLACELITHKQIVTTLAKAKALRVYVEPLITKSKVNSTHQRRIVFSYLQEKGAVTELFSTVSDKVAERPGGYTRIIKLGTRLGDAAEMAMIELVDFNELYSKEAPDSKKRRTRRGRSGKKPTAAASEAGTESKAEKEAESPEGKAAEDKVPEAVSVKTGPAADKTAKEESTETVATEAGTESKAKKEAESPEGKAAEDKVQEAASAKAEPVADTPPKEEKTKASTEQETKESEAAASASEKSEDKEAPKAEAKQKDSDTDANDAKEKPDEKKTKE